jgi:hypothetical protein
MKEKSLAKVHENKLSKKQKLELTRITYHKYADPHRKTIKR